ncbi:FeoA family protein [Xylophilus sp.]|uniref:FeoA family protein n=1 Tax=Xylophilus sp. TaxID=2653893 RepID=UPI0013BDB22A|nr:FeoA family protein [Xylophilus sp.]KAF1043821.1 MAG: hypothetical protein GAK38_03797 [Xylophilus sp.]
MKNDIPQAAAGVMGLHELPRHQVALVVGLQAARDATEQVAVLRLAEIGFVPGEEVRVVAHGFPGGEPLAVRIGQTTFALRRNEAALVQVALQTEVAA